MGIVSPDRSCIIGSLLWCDSIAVVGVASWYALGGISRQDVSCSVCMHIYWQ